MNVTGTIELITEKASMLSIGDIIAIIVAVISLIGVVVSTILTNKTTKKINKENAELQEKWNQKNIDANLIAQARIEWIQNVRAATSSLLVHYFAILNMANSENVDQELLASQEKNELLILCFGDDCIERTSDEFVREKLLEKQSNEGKNDVLVEFLLDLAMRFGEYCSAIKSDRRNKLEEAVIEARREMYANATVQKIGEEYIDEIEEFIPVEEPLYQEEDVQNVARIEISIKKEKQKVAELQKDLMFLRDVIRTYLKIEWEIAKKGK